MLTKAPFFPSVALLCAVTSVPLHSEILQWNPNGSSGGAGVWSTNEPNWLGQTGLTAWLDGSSAQLQGTAGLVEIDGTVQVEEIIVVSPGYKLELDNVFGSLLSVESIIGNPEIFFKGVIGGDTDSYPELDLLRATGLKFTPSKDFEFSGTLTPSESGSPVLQISGDAGEVTFSGQWNSDSGSIISWLVLDDGGHLILGEKAEMRFIKDGFYTLQLWVSGDGTGTLELAPGFVADKTDGGTVRKGIGSIRIGGSRLITHETANLPLGYRPQSDGSAQTNGHMAFENEAGSVWEVQSEDQVYPGAIWIYQDMELKTMSNLLHMGRTENSSDYTAWNGFSIMNPVKFLKTGSGKLTLAGDQFYAADSEIEVKEGTLEIASDPSHGYARGGSASLPNLNLRVEAGATLKWMTDGTMKNLYVRGEFQLGGELNISSGGFVDIGEGSRTELLLSDNFPGVLINSVDGPIFTAGTLVVRRLPSFLPSEGDEWVVAESGSGVFNGWILEDHTEMDLQLEVQGSRLVLTATKSPLDLPGVILVEDDFETKDDQWADLSLVPSWGSPRSQSSAFEWTNGVVRLVRSGSRSTIGYTSYSSSNGLKTFTALDHQFANSISHEENEISLDFRMRWPFPDASSGEGSRMIFAFNHDYPEGGLDLTPEGEPGSRINDSSADWWARPAYHTRIRGSTTGAGTSFLQYGGGISEEGEYEKTSNWWLPGFISGAGQIAPGAGEDFPKNSWVRTKEGMAGPELRNFRYRILPDRQELWRDDNDNGVFEKEEIKAVMPLPKSSDAPYYKYFETFEGLRIFWNGVADGSNDNAQVEIDSVRLIVQNNLSPIANAGVEVFSAVLVDGLAPVVVNASGSSDPESDSLIYFWFKGEELLSWGKDAKAVLFLPEGTQIIDLVVADASGNVDYAQTTAVVSVGKVRPVAEAGEDQTITALNDWYGITTMDASASFSPTGEIVSYQWIENSDNRILYEGNSAIVQLALDVGTHSLTLFVWDYEGSIAQDSVRVFVESADAAAPSTLVYRENFSRVNTSTEMGPWAVGWGLTSADGEPVPSVKYNGNAHRSLNSGTPVAPYVSKINANPSGTEYDLINARGNMWMNQMPYTNKTPAEWFLWTSEYLIDSSVNEISKITFYGTDESPEGLKVSPIVLIGGNWYIGWDLRVTQDRSYWKKYSIDVGTSGWYLFEPSSTFTIREGKPINRLPDGQIEAFGVYFLKDYGWYVNEFDNFELFVREKTLPKPFGAWLTRNFTAAELSNAAPGANWNPTEDADSDGLANLWEYIIGSNPRAALSVNNLAWGEVNLDSYVFYLRNSANTSDAELILMQSSNLMEWEQSQVISDTVSDTDTNEQLVRWTVPRTSNETIYFKWQARLK